jgi:hypothetical protein
MQFLGEGLVSEKGGKTDWDNVRMEQIDESNHKPALNIECMNTR